MPRKHAGGRSYGFAYDPAGRLHEVTASGLASRSYAWDGNDALVTYANGQFLARTVYGPGENEPLYQVDNQGRRIWFAHDERGSIVGSSDTAGHGGARKAYDEYGNSSNFAYQHGYTGALHLRGTGLYYMRARIYDPKLGRFLQPDPIGYGDGMNMYAYVSGDPVNGSDPSGLAAAPTEPEDQLEAEERPIFVTGARRSFSAIGASSPLFVRRPITFHGPTGVWDCDFQAAGCTYSHDIVVTAKLPGAVQRRRRSRSQLRATARPRQDWCGSSGTEWVPDGEWPQACRKHDECYSRPGATKEACDLRIAIDITYECTARRNWPPFCAQVGLLYGGGLAALGLTPFFHPSKDAFVEAQRQSVQER